MIETQPTKMILTGTWDVTGVSGTSGPFSYSMNLEHSPQGELEGSTETDLTGTTTTTTTSTTTTTTTMTTTTMMMNTDDDNDDDYYYCCYYYYYHYYHYQY